MDENMNRGFEQESDEITIDLRVIVQAILRKIWVIAACAVVGGIISAIYTVAFVTPMYSASSMIYIYSKTTSITSLADLQMGTQLAVDFQIVAKTHEVMENVIEKLNLNTTYEGMMNCVNITAPPSSHILQIDVIDPDPYVAADISNAVANELRQRIADVMNTDVPSMVERAVVPQEPFSPNFKINVIGGAMIFAFIASCVVVVLHLMDDSIKTDYDVTRYLGLDTLAMIPQDRSRRADGTVDKRSGKERKSRR